MIKVVPPGVPPVDLAGRVRGLFPGVPPEDLLGLTWVFLQAQSEFLVACYLDYMREVSSKLGGSDEAPR